MKYKDRHTLNQQSKQLDKQLRESDDYLNQVAFGSDRKSRREMERQLDKFETKICTYLTKDWWNSLSFEDRKEIYTEYRNMTGWMRHSNQTTLTLQEFSEKVKGKYKPIVSLYRDKIIDKILNIKYK